jgi:hypothetical protein
MVERKKGKKSKYGKKKYGKKVMLFKIFCCDDGSV